FSEIVRLCSEHAVGLFVDGANYDDVARDSDDARRAVTLSKLEKFQKLRSLPSRPEHEWVARFGAINSDNDRSDVRLLAAVDAKAVDFLVSQDDGLHRRANRAGMDSKILTVEEALEWLRQIYQKKPIALPYITEQKAYQIDQKNSIFASLRQD